MPTEHLTGRQCDEPECRGYLEDQIINFGEKIPQAKVLTALEHAAQADLCLSLGSSLRVQPANQIPLVTVKKGGKLALVK